MLRKMKKAVERLWISLKELDEKSDRANEAQKGHIYIPVSWDENGKKYYGRCAYRSVLEALVAARELADELGTEVIDAQEFELLSDYLDCNSSCGSEVTDDEAV